MSDIFEKVQQIQQALEAETPANAEALEAFRIQYLGSKGILKSLMGEMANVPNERKRDYGQLMNALKQAAEAKFQALKETFETQAQSSDSQALDLTAPGEAIALGSRHPIAVTMNRIVEIFTRMGFSVADGPEIEDDWHNFTAMNTPEDHPRPRYAGYVLCGRCSWNVVAYTHVARTSARDGIAQAAHSHHRPRSRVPQ